MPLSYYALACLYTAWVGRWVLEQGLLDYFQMRNLCAYWLIVSKADTFCLEIVLPSLTLLKVEQLSKAKGVSLV